MNRKPKASKATTAPGQLSNEVIRILVFTVVALLFAPLLVDFAYNIGDKYPIFRLSFSREQILNNLSAALGAMSALWIGLLSFRIARQSNEIATRLLDLETARQKPALANARIVSTSTSIENAFNSMNRILLHIGEKQNSLSDYLIGVEFTNISQNPITRCTISQCISSRGGNLVAMVKGTRSWDISVPSGGILTFVISALHTVRPSFIEGEVKHDQGAPEIINLGMMLEVHSYSAKSIYHFGVSEVIPKQEPGPVIFLDPVNLDTNAH